MGGGVTWWAQRGVWGREGCVAGAHKEVFGRGRGNWAGTKRCWWGGNWVGAKRCSGDARGVGGTKRCWGVTWWAQRGVWGRGGGVAGGHKEVFRRGGN